MKTAHTRLHGFHSLAIIAASISEIFHSKVAFKSMTSGSFQRSYHSIRLKVLLFPVLSFLSSSVAGASFCDTKQAYHCILAGFTDWTYGWGVIEEYTETDMINMQNLYISTYLRVHHSCHDSEQVSDLLWSHAPPSYDPCEFNYTHTSPLINGQPTMEYGEPVINGDVSWVAHGKGSASCEQQTYDLCAYLRRFRQPQCPDGYNYPVGSNVPGDNGTYCLGLKTFSPGEPQFVQSCQSGDVQPLPDYEANPCNPATGNKFQFETDWQSANGALNLRRYYNSKRGGTGWAHSFTRNRMVADENQHTFIAPFSSESPMYFLTTGRVSYGSRQSACEEGFDSIKLEYGSNDPENEDGPYAGLDASFSTSDNSCKLFDGTGTLVGYLPIYYSAGARYDLNYMTVPVNLRTIRRPDGSRITFELQEGEWRAPFNSLLQLEELPSGSWLLTLADQSKEKYDAGGRMIWMETRDGKRTTLRYGLSAEAGGDDNPDTLDKVIGPFGRELLFKYSEGKLVRVMTPDGDIQYGYDSYGNLETVTYPDNTVRTYHYGMDDGNGNITLPHHLTGITDERGIRFATWEYDNLGRVVLSKHANDAEQVNFTYNVNGTTTVRAKTDVENENGEKVDAERTYHFTNIAGARRVTDITGDKCATCGNRDLKSRSYRSDGKLELATDWEGNQTFFKYYDNGLLKEKIEAYGDVANQRVTKYEWHPAFNLPTKIIEPDQTTTIVYDNTTGRVTSKVVSATPAQ